MVRGRWAVGLAIGLGAYSLMVPAPTPSQTVSLTFAQAQSRLDHVSDGLEASRAGVRSKEAQARSTRTLRRPEVSIDAREVDFQKSLELPLGSLAPLAAPFGLPSTLMFRQEGWRTRPEVSATIPLYDGGQILATQAGAKAQVRQAQAEADQSEQTGLVQLAQAYFGQQLADRAVRVRLDVRDGLERHLADALKLEREGFATRAQALQAQVARDDAQREYDNSVGDLATAQAVMSGLLREAGTVATATPLFVLRKPVGTLSEFVSAAVAHHPQIARLTAQADQAEQGVRLQQAKQRPTVYGFAQYDLYRHDAFLTDPDWIFGVGVRYTLLSNVDRREAVRAAREQQAQAQAGVWEARTQVTLGVTKAYNDLETSRRQFLLFDSSLAAARENVRLQELSYRESQATSLDVIDARLGLGRAELLRAQAATQFLDTLMQLLSAAGEADQFTVYADAPDRIILP